MNLNAKTRTLIQRLSQAVSDQPIDAGMIPLINAVNEFQGIQSDVCCEGHGLYFPYLFFTVDGQAPALSGLGLIAHAARDFDWLVSLAPTGRETRQYYFQLVPVSLYRFSPDGQVIKIAGDPELVSAEQQKLAPLGQTLMKLAGESVCELRKPLIRLAT